LEKEKPNKKKNFCEIRAKKDPLQNGPATKWVKPKRTTTKRAAA